jgi:hypothetical protein
MSDDTFTASDFQSAESTSSDAGTPTPDGSSAPVDTTAQPEGATTQPAVAATVVSPSTEPTKPQGPIPFDDHKRILENARKANDEYRQRVGWAEQIDPQEFQQVQQLARTLSANPIEGLQQLIGEIRKDPQYDAQLKSLAARALSQRSQPAPAEPEMVQVQLEDGSVVMMPRDPQAWLAHQQRQWEANLEQRLQPLQKTHEQLQAERQALQQQQQIEHFVTSTMTDVTTWQGMETKEAQAALANDLAQARINPNDPREVRDALNNSYRRVIVPTLLTGSRQAVLNDIQRQAGASTVNPSQSGTRAPKTMEQMSIAEALRYVDAQQG